MAGNKQVVIDVGEKQEFNHSWMHSMKSKIMESCEAERFFNGPQIFIPRVGENVRSGIEDYYNPKLVSVGPYHHGNSQLQAMEGYKAKCLKDLLDRNSTPFEKCFEEVREKEAQARKCYKVAVEQSVLEIGGDHGSGCWLHYRAVHEAEPGSPPICVLFDLPPHQTRPAPLGKPAPVRHLAVHVRPHRQKRNQPHTPRHCLRFLQPSRAEEKRSASAGLRAPPAPSSSVPVHPRQSFLNPGPISSIPSANNLHVMGVEFKPASKESLLTDVEFNKEDVVMQIPHLFIAEETIALFTNLITFEQTHIGFGTHFTSYAVFISYILSDEVDVEFLSEKGIIEHRLANHKEVVHLFRYMCSGVFIDPHFSTLSSVLRDVKHYSQ